MAHFAELDENNVVVAVICVANDELLDGGVESEAKGVEFLESLYGHARWKQTSYNGTIRKNYAGAGFTYDSSRDAFIPPRPEGECELDEETCRWISIPRSVTARQIRLWLVANGISLDAVDDAIAAIPDATQRRIVWVEWHFAPYVERSHPMLIPLAGALGLSQAQVDAAFVQAARL